jgi:hypothetical protein
MQTSIRLRQLSPLGLSIMLLGSTACVTWSPAKPEPAPAPATTAGTEGKETLRVTKVNGTVVELHHAVFTLDSVIGVVDMPKGDTAGITVATRVAIPADSVRQVQIRAVSAGNTILLVVGIAAAAFLTGILFWLGSGKL